MTDAERVLQALLHDLRTPIGVAQGYLRMMQEGRLTAAAETERALAKALAALGQTARLCQDAGDFIETSRGHGRTTDIPAVQLVAEVERLAGQRSMEIATTGVPAQARLALTGDKSEMADAVFLVLTIGGGHRPIRVDADDGGLRFMAGGAGSAAGAEAFDPWSHGLAVAAAGRRITWSSGQIQKLGTGNGLIVTFPLTAGTGTAAIG